MFVEGFTADLDTLTVIYLIVSGFI
ncbi:hypothetical protein EVA_12940, partial [gut metagenome]